MLRHRTERPRASTPDPLGHEPPVIRPRPEATSPPNRSSIMVQRSAVFQWGTPDDGNHSVTGGSFGPGNPMSLRFRASALTRRRRAPRRGTPCPLPCRPGPLGSGARVSPFLLTLDGCPTLTGIRHGGLQDTGLPHVNEGLPKVTMNPSLVAGSQYSDSATIVAECADSKIQGSAYDSDSSDPKMWYRCRGEERFALESHPPRRRGGRRGTRSQSASGGALLRPAPPPAAVSFRGNPYPARGALLFAIVVSRSQVEQPSPPRTQRLRGEQDGANEQPSGHRK
jgi:hypothetical protein